MDIRLIKLDFETFYDTKQDFSLKKMTTEAYLRDPRFEVLMVTIKINKEKTYAVVGQEAVRAHLVSLQLDAPGTVVFAHNARFDISIIEWFYGLRVNMSICSIYLMRETGISRMTGESLDALSKFLYMHGIPTPRKGHAVVAMDGKHLSDMTEQELADYVDYAITDTDILSIGVDVMLPLCGQDAIEAMNMTLQMYTRPILQINLPLLIDYKEMLHQRREAALSEMAAEYNCPNVETFMKTIRSKPKFAALLESLGVEPPTKVSVKKTEKMGFEVRDFAFAKNDLEFRDLQYHYNDKVVALVTARLENNSSIAESRTQSFIEIGYRGTLPIPLEYAGAHTGRYAAGTRDDTIKGDGTNVQNLPKRGGDKTLRTSMMAPVGFEIGAADSSQVEARLLAYAAQERELLAVFETGGDPYSVMASRIYGIPAETIYYYSKGGGSNPAKDDVEGQRLHALHTGYRNVGKETILGSGYQMSGAKFAIRLKQLGILLQPTADEIVEWDIRHPFYTNPAVREAEKTLWLEEFHTNEAKRINSIYRKTNEKIKGFWSVCDYVLQWMIAGDAGYFGGPDGTLFYYDGNHTVLGERVPGIMLPNGYWLVFPGLRSYTEEGTGWTKYTYLSKKGRTLVDKLIYGGSLTENLIQALAFAVLKWQAVRIHRQLPVRMNVHDEWASVYQPQYRAQVEALYMHWMRQSPPWCPGVPLDCEFKAGPNYGAC